MEENTAMEENRIPEETGKRKKAKKTWPENGAPFYMWLLALAIGVAAGMAIGSFAGGFIKALVEDIDSPLLNPEKDLLSNMAVFVCIFWALVLNIRIFCKTSMRSFFFGKGRKIDVRSTVIIGALYLLGMTLAQLLSLKNITCDGQPVLIVIINFVFCLLLVWMQTSAEEIVFRGIFLRIPFKNEIPKLSRGLLAAVVSSLLFMAGHLYNPEVTTQSGTSVILAASVYFLSGFLMFVSNLLIGGMEAGLLIHLINNFFCFFFVRAEVTALMTPAIFVDHTENNIGLIQLFGVLISFAPAYVFLLLHRRRLR